MTTRNLLRLLLIAVAALTSPTIWGAAPAATVDTITISSGLIPQPMKITVAVPCEVPAEGCPTLYLLNGHGGDYRNWPKILPVDSIAAHYGMVIVCPSGMNSWYWDSPADSTMKMESFITNELVAAIDSLYPTRPQREYRAVTGLSMGGHGALWLALNHPDLFGSAGSTSGGVDIRPFPKSWNMARYLGDRDENTEVWNSHTVTNFVEQLAAADLNLIIDCGYDDFFYEVNCEFDRKLNEAKIPHTFITGPGGHTFAYWQKSIYPQIDFFARKFGIMK